MPPEFVPPDRAGGAEKAASAREPRADERSRMLAREIAKNIVIVRRDDPNRKKLLRQDMAEEESRINQLERSMQWKLMDAHKADTATQRSGRDWIIPSAAVQEHTEDLSEAIAWKFRASRSKQSVQVGV